MSLGNEQRDFTRMLGMLLRYAHYRGYGVTLGRGYVSKEENARVGGHPKSLHMLKLAQDLNLFTSEVDGDFLTKTEDHKELGEYWEVLGGTWGGRFGDGNHYSKSYKGMK